MRRYFIRLGSGENSVILDVSSFVCYYKDRYANNCWSIVAELKSKDQNFVKINYLNQSDRDEDFERLFLSTQEYNLDEIHNLRQTKGSEE